MAMVSLLVGEYRAVKDQTRCAFDGELCSGLNSWYSAPVMPFSTYWLFMREDRNNKFIKKHNHLSIHDQLLLLSLVLTLIACIKISLLKPDHKWRLLSENHTFVSESRT